MIDRKNLRLITAFAVFTFGITLSATDGWAKKSPKKMEAPVPAAASTPAPIMTAPRSVTLPPGFNSAPPPSAGKPVMNTATATLPPGFNPPGYQGPLTPPAKPPKSEAMKEINAEAKAAKAEVKTRAKEAKAALKAKKAAELS